MIGLLVPSALAALLGVACGGSLARCLSARVAGWPILLGAFAVELILYSPPVNRLEWAVAAGPSIWIVCKLLMLAVLVGNVIVNDYIRPAWLLIFAGIALNTLAIVANGGHMPQSPGAAASVWGAEYVRADTYSVHLENVSWMDRNSTLPWLCDILPLPRWVPLPNVLSIGDVLLAVGVGWWILGSALRTPDARGNQS